MNVNLKKREEVNTMKYQKPEIQVVVSALVSVQSMDKEQETPVDSSGIFKTVPAYQADE